MSTPASSLGDGPFGGPRPRPLSTRDVLAMVQIGTIGEGERVELIDGELLQMSPKNRRHELVKNWLNEKAVDGRGDAYRVSIEGTLYLSETTFVEPDVTLIPPGTVISDLSGADILLVIEVSDTTLRHDLVRKPRIYAKHDVREYWAIDVEKGCVIVHREPEDDHYRSVTEHGDDVVLSPIAAPHLHIRLADAH